LSAALLCQLAQCRGGAARQGGRLFALGQLGEQLTGLVLTV
jgi:hypothetical protein